MRDYGNRCWRKVLPYIIDNIANGVKMRMKNQGPLNIILAETSWMLMP